MTTQEAKQIEEGIQLAYDDGRGVVYCQVIEVHQQGMRVQFEDRASSTFIMFKEQAWMKYLTIWTPSNS